MIRYLFTALSVSWLLVPLMAASNANATGIGLRIAGYQNEILLPADKSGPYSRIITAIGDEAGIPLTMEILPAKRAWRRMHGPKPEVHCEFPSALAHLPVDRLDVTDYIQAKAINNVRVYAVAREGRAPIGSVSELEGLRLAYNRGYGYGPELSPILRKEKPFPAQLFPVENDMQGLRMLLVYDRTDVMVSYYPELLSYLQREKLPTPVYDLNKPLWQVEDAILCRRSARVSSLLRDLNGAIDALLQRGVIQAILGDLYLPAPRNK
ncbi:substrate-binding periplasmic protein [Aestuariispira insulae]|uniref:ABC-type amino acid transport substrate-binding protein n=1 Tax=Aestuariispira insulae TaxID=1461337 RepID=A0A3D9H9I1_9PROT|nr:hypothetical protein [Aestuariispira insulae]RED46137.1 ABC-type amino acid transport substrate-binding protein [Aestuariispira insulae]